MWRLKIHTEIAVIDTSKLETSSPESNKLINFSELDKQIRQIWLKCIGFGSILCICVFFLIQRSQNIFELRWNDYGEQNKSHIALFDSWHLFTC